MQYKNVLAITGRDLRGMACRLKSIVREALSAYFAVFEKYSLADLVTNGEALRSLLQITSISDDRRNALV